MRQTCDTGPLSRARQLEVRGGSGHTRGMWDTDWAVWMLMGGAAAAFVALQFLSAPYGRHAREGWGPTVGQRWGWFWMEIPTLAVFLPVFAMGEAAHRIVPRVLVGLWLVHYVHRTLVYPLRIRASGKRTPWVVVGMAFVFQVLNSGLNADWIAGAGHYPKAWLWDPRFVSGVALFGLGQGLNHHSDRLLRNLRAPGETGSTRCRSSNTDLCTPRPPRPSSSPGSTDVGRRSSRISCAPCDTAP